jgi:hypothetical protein
MQWPEYLAKGTNPSTSSSEGERQQIVIDITDDGAACKAALENYIKSSEQEWCMLLEACLKFQLRQNKPTAGLKNLQTNLARILKTENVAKDDTTLVSILEGSLYYMRAVLVNSEAFIGYPIEMLEAVISRIAVTLLEIKNAYMAGL